MAAKGILHDVGNSAVTIGKLILLFKILRGFFLVIFLCSQIIVPTILLHYLSIATIHYNELKNIELQINEISDRSSREIKFNDLTSKFEKKDNSIINIFLSIIILSLYAFYIISVFKSQTKKVYILFFINSIICSLWILGNVTVDLRTKLFGLSFYDAITLIASLFQIVIIIILLIREHAKNAHN